MPITVPAGVEVSVADGNVVTVKGPKGTLTKQLHPAMVIEQNGTEISVKRPSDSKEHRSLHGLTRTLLHNMVVGVHETYKKELEINGVGYRAVKEGKNLVMNLGYSHQVTVPEVDGITIDVPPPTRSSSPAATSSRWASSPPRSGRSVLPNRTRARASSMPTRSSAARWARPARRSKEAS
jgi:large subunit ribosomal protein L6